MHQERRRPRVYTNEMNHFEVILEAGESRWAGYVGDISEEGMCAVLPGSAWVAADEGGILRGRIGGSYLSSELNFEARVVWQSSSEHRGQAVQLVGLQFSGAVELPDQVIAALLVSEED